MRIYEAKDKLLDALKMPFKDVPEDELYEIVNAISDLIEANCRDVEDRINRQGEYDPDY